MACEAWSGDVIQAQFDNPDIKFVVPEEGLSLWSDNMLVPNQATHQANAEKWINYYYEPEVAAKLAAWVNYICPVEGAREAMEKIDPTLVDNPLIFPDEDDLEDTFDFMALNEADSKTVRRRLVRCHRWLNAMHDRRPAPVDDGVRPACDCASADQGVRRRSPR